MGGVGGGQVFEFRNKTIKEYIGDIYDFLESRKIRTLRQLETNQKGRNEGSDKKASANKLNWEKRKDAGKELRKLQTRIQQSETVIEKLENDIKETEEILIQPEKFKDKVLGGKVYNEYNRLKILLENEMKKWEELQQELEELEKRKPD